MNVRVCGRSGLKLSAVGLGLWQSFGTEEGHDACFRRVAAAFDLGITHIDLADNYGPPPGMAETLFGLVLAREFKAYRDELVVATKAGHAMWPGPYGDWGSRKHLIAGLDQSLRRLRLDYVDLFYHHRPIPRRRSKRPSAHWRRSSVRARRSTSGSPNIRPTSCAAPSPCCMRRVCRVWRIRYVTT